MAGNRGAHPPLLGLDLGQLGVKEVLQWFGGHWAVVGCTLATFDRSGCVFGRYALHVLVRYRNYGCRCKNIPRLNIDRIDLGHYCGARLDKLIGVVR